ncbi:hypothetical protein [Streptomyces sp. NRRL S-87]|uniref:hypothetical protein n=1 Tax=Streptomyces sp. NRRL S-87 TaxID=1463920 RepID=UPI000ACB15CA|nr:hypothetical protein [Streptomyces sp. NRRL S-87]
MDALINLFEATDFEVLFQPERMPLPQVGLLEAFPPEAVKQAGTSWSPCTESRRTRGPARGRGPATDRVPR